jgi:hypothetical protein
LRYTGHTQKNGAVSELLNKFFIIWAQLTLSAARNVQVSFILLAVRFSCLLRGRGTFQDGVAAGEGFLLLRFEVSRSVITVQPEFHTRFKRRSTQEQCLLQTMHETQAAL